MVIVLHFKIFLWLTCRCQTGILWVASAWTWGSRRWWPPACWWLWSPTWSGASSGCSPGLCCSWNHNIGKIRYKIYNSFKFVMILQINTVVCTCSRNYSLKKIIFRNVINLNFKQSTWENLPHWWFQTCTRHRDEVLRWEPKLFFRQLLRHREFRQLLSPGRLPDCWADTTWCGSGRRGLPASATRGWRFRPPESAPHSTRLEGRLSADEKVLI